jgi:hypothetical protein
VHACRSRTGVAPGEVDFLRVGHRSLCGRVRRRPSACRQGEVFHFWSGITGPYAGWRRGIGECALGSGAGRGPVFATARNADESSRPAPGPMPSAGDLSAVPQARGESSLSRRSGRCRRRCTAWRDGGSRAASSLVMCETEFPFQLLVIARSMHQRSLARSTKWSNGVILRDGGQPIFGGHGVALWPFDQQPFLARLGPPIIAMGRPYPNPGKPRCQWSLLPRARKSSASLPRADRPRVSRLRWTLDLGPAG